MISLNELRSILENNQPSFVEALAKKAYHLTIRHFGKTVSLYSPLYISNYCENRCVYCGFQTGGDMKRKKLSCSEMTREMEVISKSGIQNVLILTGDSPKMTPVEYVLEAVNMAKKYFPRIHLEVYPLGTEEYHKLFQNGVDV